MDQIILPAIAELKNIYSKGGESLVPAFERQLATIAQVNDPAVIGQLLTLLDDGAEYDELMFSLIHTIEQFNDDDYVSQIIRALPKQWKATPKWLQVIHVRIINSESTMECYVSTIAKASEEIKGVSREVFRAVADRWASKREKALQAVARIA